MESVQAWFKASICRCVGFRRDFLVLQKNAKFTYQEVALPLLWLSYLNASSVKLEIKYTRASGR